jgi:hypothetical protein
MTRLLEQAVEAVSALPDEAQDELTVVDSRPARFVWFRAAVSLPFPFLAAAIGKP